MTGGPSGFHDETIINIITTDMLDCNWNIWQEVIDHLGCGILVRCKVGANVVGCGLGFTWFITGRRRRVRYSITNMVSRNNINKRKKVARAKKGMLQGVDRMENYNGKPCNDSNRATIWL